MFRLSYLVWAVVLCMIVMTGCAKKEVPSEQLTVDAEDRVIVMPSDVAEKIEIRTEPVKRRKLNLALHVTGQIKPDVGKEVNVNTRFSGRVTDVMVKPGEMVRIGQPLAKVDSRQITDLQAELVEAKAKLSIAEAQAERERQVYEEQLQRPKTLIQARTHYDESKVHLELAESEYKRQEGLYREKISAQKDYLRAKAAWAKAKAAFEQAEVDLQREERLYENKALMKRNLQIAQAEVLRAKQHQNMLKQRLKFLGMGAGTIQQVMNTGNILGVVPVVSPANGIVTHQGIAVGEIIDPDTQAFTITDLSDVVVAADLPEVDVQRVKKGHPVQVRIHSYPDKVFKGIVSYISENVNQETRTVAIRARLPNKERRLKKNMFAEIDITGVPIEKLACPKSAIQERDGRKVVYLATKEGFHERQIETGSETEQFVAVTSGLEEGDVVATQGSLMLKTELTYQH